VIRNRRGEPAPMVSATDAKNQFARVFESAVQHGAVVITKHDAPKAVLLSLEEFQALTAPSRRALDDLSGELDALVARMQTPQARAGMKAAFAASPEELGKAAVAAARKRG